MSSELVLSDSARSLIKDTAHVPAFLLICNLMLITGLIHSVTYLALSSIIVLHTVCNLLICACVLQVHLPIISRKTFLVACEIQCHRKD